MAWEFFAKGAAIGLAIAAPVGPIGVLCIRRTLADGRAAGLATGLGAATADACYGALAAFGLMAASALLLAYQEWLQLAGGLFLCALGVRTFRLRPTATPPRPQRGALAGAYASATVLTLAKPAKILSFAAVFAGAGLVQARAAASDASAVVAGVFLGSAAWWLLLSGFVARWRQRYPGVAGLAPRALGGAVITGVALGAAGRTLQRINRASGLLLIGFGVAAVFSTAA